jgi:integrase
VLKIIFKLLFSALFLIQKNMSSVSSKTTHHFLELFEKFIKDSSSGRRLQKNGRRITSGSLKNYEYTLKLLRDFTTEKNFDLRIRSIQKLNKREIIVERNYWKKFYKKFSDYLYDDLDLYDNYVGANFKLIRTFFNYLNDEIGINTGAFHKLFYVHKENIQIIVLRPEQLQFLIQDKDFETKLSDRLKRTKDIFVFGCTVALRISDLMNLNESNLEFLNDRYYLKVISKKTQTSTRVKLPDYAVEIINKYRKKKKPLLPRIGLANLNENIRLLIEEAGWTQPFLKTRSKKGIQKQIYKNTNRDSLRFCDLVSSHTMRRTAITTMLCLGMSELVVRKVSGHSPHSREFFKYVELSQNYMDNEIEKIHSLLTEKKSGLEEVLV